MTELASSVTPLTFTDSAARKVYELIEEEGDLALNLRVGISGGGCSGFQYGFSFTKDISEDDTIIEKGIEEAVVKLLVDPMSLQYLVGAVIDYKDDLDGQRFVIRNPNAKTTCGCGSSFSAADETEEDAA